MSLKAEVSRVRSREDLVSFLEALAEDAVKNPAEWENTSVAQYLDALAAWLGEMDGYSRNQGQEAPTVPSWSLVGQACLAAKYYE